VETAVEKRELVKMLQAKINAMQGFGKASDGCVPKVLAPFDDAFPGGVFPLGKIHEFISYEPTDAAATTGFITALAGKLIKNGGLCLWIGNERKIFPSGLKHFGLEPDRVVFINTSKKQDLLWIIEEALKCDALTAVIGELKELGFTESRRLQLAVENSGVNGFIHRYQPRAENAVACTTRWKITSLPSAATDGLPGIGHSCWDIQLLKVKNGQPFSWQIHWTGGQFMPLANQTFSISNFKRHAV